jgi:signal transduction histidine kinase
LPEFHRILDADALSLYQRLTAGISAGRSSTPSDDRRRRRALAVVLAEAGLNDAESLAEDIVQLVGPNDEAAVVEHAVAGRGPIIRQASQTLSLYQSSVIIQEAADRAASTVTALVEYSRAETYRHDSVVYPEADIETLLTLSLGAAKKGVVVVRRFEQGLAFQGDRDRLNQVWANLIHNAVQALDGHGVLQVETRSVANRVEIRFGNDGPAIPPEIGDKIFLPFFTTKKAGEGTGLGICRRIVEAHGGTLTCRQEGGLTVFCVSLPLSQS